MQFSLNQVLSMDGGGKLKVYTHRLVNSNDPACLGPVSPVKGKHLYYKNPHGVSSLNTDFLCSGHRHNTVKQDFREL